MLLWLYLLHNVFYFVLFTVQDHPPLFLVLQILEQWAVSLILPLVFQVPHVYRCHLPLPLCCCVQNNLQRCQSWGWSQDMNHTFCLIYPGYSLEKCWHDTTCWKMGAKPPLVKSNKEKNHTARGCTIYTLSCCWFPRKLSSSNVRDIFVCIWNCMNIQGLEIATKHCGNKKRKNNFWNEKCNNKLQTNLGADKSIKENTRFAYFNPVEVSQRLGDFCKELIKMSHRCSGVNLNNMWEESGSNGSLDCINDKTFWLLFCWTKPLWFFPLVFWNNWVIDKTIYTWGPLTNSNAFHCISQP